MNVFIISFKILLISVVVGLSTQSERKLTCKTATKRFRRDLHDPQILTICETSETIDESWIENVANIDRNKVNTLKACSCTLKRHDDLEHFHCFTNLHTIFLTDLELKTFDLSYVDNNPRLHTLNLDNNPIEKLENDAQISLNHLSLLNSSMTALPDYRLHIMKHLKSLNITGDKFNVAHEVVCIKYEELEMFNGKPCKPIQDFTEEPIVKVKEPKKSFGTSLQPAGTMSMYLSTTMLLIMGGASRNWVGLLVILGCIHFNAAAMLFDPLIMSDATDLHLESRGISSLDDNEFASLPNLTHLYLSNNSLTQLNINSDSLTYLDVKNNQLQTIQNDIFNGLPRLRKLLLAGNALKEVNWNLDSSKAAIKNVDLSRNQALRAVNITSQTLNTLSLAENSIDELILNTPNLALIDFHNAYYSGGDLEDICNQNARNNFRITYVREDKDTTDFYECKASIETFPVQSKINKVLSREPYVVKKTEVAPKQTGCQLSTLRMKIDDIVISSHRYYQLNLLFMLLSACVILMCCTLVWLTLEYNKLYQRTAHIHVYQATKN